MVQCLITQGKANIEAKHKYDHTPLHVAAAEGHLDVVQWLTTHDKVNVDAKDEDGGTPPHVAAAEGQLDVVQWLITHGKANVEAKNEYGHTPLHVAAMKGHLNVVQWLITHDKVNVDAKDEDGGTPPHVAAAEGQLDVVQWLITHGMANIEAKNEDDYTPLRLKEEMKKGEVKKILRKLENKAKIYPEHEGLHDCIRYMNNRPGQFKYDKAQEKGLPIGSGKIESTHRHVIQARLKKAGAWWKRKTAEVMADLRVLRANGKWDLLWQSKNDADSQQIAA